MQTTQVKSRNKKISVVIHGHFYQPPRENPWTNSIPLQESARPYHDWNDRISAECYKPNTRSRALDEQGRILKLVNNFASLNFNIGPTLMSWMEESYPDTYRRILEADRLSCEQNRGHGNAIAQVYNHVIMPLANKRDKFTQIFWGRQEFEYRFKRMPESIWLAETAINQETVRGLIEQGMKYVILSPTQAWRIREIGGSDWTDVSHNGIDTTQAYRIFLKEEEPQTEIESDEADGDVPREETFTPDGAPFLDVFFYDGGLSTEISFQHLLRDANTFVHRLRDSVAKSHRPHALAHVATDGEVYGHHEAYGDMCLAAAVTSKFPELQVDVTNYGRFLELHPPTIEVELKAGDNGEGTAWSCAHGVGRWYRDCGCSASNNPAWNQAWRTSLRKGFDVLRDALAELFEQLGGELLRDPWEARNAYITCILDPSEQNVNAFLDAHAAHPLSNREKSAALCLLEAQKYSMFTYTSCAWFFDDISGLEPIQNMRYAARTLQLIDEFQSSNAVSDEILSAHEIEKRMLAEFEHAVSNLPEFGNGKDIYRRFVTPDIYTPERAANQFLLEHFINARRRQEPTDDDAQTGQPLFSSQEMNLHIYQLRCVESTRWQSQPGQELESPQLSDTVTHVSQHLIPFPEMYGGLLHIQENVTRQEWKLLFLSFIEQDVQPVSYIQRVTDASEWHAFLEGMSHFTTDDGQMLRISPSELTPFLEEFGCRRYGLADVYYDDREHLFSRMLEEHVASTEEHIRRIYDDNLELLRYLTSMNVQVPEKLQASVKFSLSHQLMLEMEKLSAKELNRSTPRELRLELERILDLSVIHHIELDTGVLQTQLSQALTCYLANLAHSLSLLEEQAGDDGEVMTAQQSRALEILGETLTLLEKAKELGVALDKAELQNIVYDMLQQVIPRYLTTFKRALTSAQEMEEQTAFEQQIFYRFFKEYTFIQECLKLAHQLGFSVSQYRKHLVLSEHTTLSTR